MAEILRGAAAAKALCAGITEKTVRLKERGVTPCLAFLRVGAREDDLAYEQAAVKRCGTVGIAVKNVVLPGDAPQETLMSAIHELNSDTEVHGILVFSPLPGHLDIEPVRRALLPEKDVDGITYGSMAAVYGGTGAGFPPCTASACVELLKHYGIPLEGKRAAVIGRSLVIGKPAAMLLLNENATVTICHSRSQDLQGICREADILVVAAGRAGLAGREFFRPGQVVLDVGYNIDKEGNICGDVRFDEAESTALAVTPVPGGVGSVTTAILASHVVEAAERTLDLSK